MTTDELIEKAAKAIWVTRNGGDSAWAEMAWSELTAPDDWNREALDALDEARAAFTVFEQAQAEPEWEYECKLDDSGWTSIDDVTHFQRCRGEGRRRRKAGPWVPVEATDD